MKRTITLICAILLAQNLIFSQNTDFLKFVYKGATDTISIKENEIDSVNIDLITLKQSAVAKIKNRQFKNAFIYSSDSCKWIKIFLVDIRVSAIDNYDNFFWTHKYKTLISGDNSIGLRFRGELIFAEAEKRGLVPKEVLLNASMYDKMKIGKAGFSNLVIKKWNKLMYATLKSYLKNEICTNLSGYGSNIYYYFFLDLNINQLITNQDFQNGFYLIETNYVRDDIIHNCFYIIKHGDNNSHFFDYNYSNKKYSLLSCDTISVNIEEIKPLFEELLEAKLASSNKNNNITKFNMSFFKDDEIKIAVGNCKDFMSTYLKLIERVKQNMDK